MRISDWSSDVCSSDLNQSASPAPRTPGRVRPAAAPARNQARAAIRSARVRGTPGTARGRPRHRRRYLPNKPVRSEEHTSELQSLMRISYAVFCLKKKIKQRSIMTEKNKKKNNLATQTPTT